MRSGVFISARTDSSRLQGKLLKKLVSGDRVIEHDINRALLARSTADEVIVCTTERPLDDKLCEISFDSGARIFRGSLDDKLDRWLKAAKEYEIDIIANFDGDDLFCEPDFLEIGIEQMKNSDVDFVRMPKGFVCGSFTYCIRTSALEQVCEMKGTDKTEMMSGYFEERFKCEDLKLTDKDISIYYSDEVRLTLDYQEDFDFFNKVLETWNFSTHLKHLMVYLTLNPSIAKINSFRQADFLANQKRITNYKWKDK